MLPEPDNQKHVPFSKGWLMLLAFGLGLVYLFLLPPWQQNDEPGQFEYAWLVANLNHWPQLSDVNPQLRREVMTSMIEHGFYRGNPQPPDLADLKDPVNIGVSQVGGMPLYYFLASLPLRLFHPAEIDQQFYLMRLVSLLLFVATGYFAIQTTDLLFGNHLIGWMMAIFIAMLPQLVYRMTAVNDDAAAIATMSFFIWMSVRGIKYGANWKTILGIVISMTLCVLSKATAWLAVPFGVLALLLSIFHTRTRLVWAGVFGLVIVVILAAFDWRADIPADYYQYYGAEISGRVQSQQAIDGKYVILTNRQHNGFYQVLDKSILTTQTSMVDRKVTVGVWAWSNKPVEVHFPQLQFNGQDVLNAETIALSDKPVFLATQVQIPENYSAPVLRVNTKGLPGGVEVYWDCFVLVPGERNLQSLPKTSENCSHVEWDGYNGENLIRNPSAERGWFSLHEKAYALFTRFYHLQITDFWAIFDPPAGNTYYGAALQYLFRTFWGRFNWGSLALAGNKPYRIFILPSLLALLGSGIAFWRYHKVLNWTQVIFFLLLVTAGLLYTLSRFAGNWNNYYYFLPQARYFFPYIFPTTFFICLGWYAVLEPLLKVIHLEAKFVPLFIGVFLSYNAWAWYTIWQNWY